MKTPMKELFYILKERASSLKEVESLTQPLSSLHRILQTQIEELEQILLLEDEFIKKEKEAMCQFQSDGQRTDFFAKYEDNDDCFEQTFNTKRNEKFL